MNLKQILRQLDHGNVISDYEDETMTHVVEIKDKSIPQIITSIKEAAASYAADHVDEFGVQLVSDYDDWVSMAWDEATYGLEEWHREELWGIFYESLCMLVAEKCGQTKAASTHRMELDRQIDLLETNGLQESEGTK